MSIRARLFLMFLLTVLLFASLGSYALLAYRDGLTGIQELQESAHAATEGTHLLRLRLERELAAWKNVLLRGNEQSAYYRYLQEYYAQERAARNEIEALTRLLEGDPLLLSQMKQLTQSHHELGRSLREAIRVFNSGEENAHRLADRVVANHETSLHGLVDQITGAAEEKAGARVTALESRFANQQKLMVVLLVIIGASTIFSFFWLLDRSVGKPAERAAFLANYDPLTNLPNRNLFQDRMQHAIDKAGRDNCRLTLFFLDLDQFKGVNDALGHHVGDELLQQVGGRLREILRSSDTVARLGGDEFAVLVENSGDEVSNAHVAQNIVNSVGQPYDVGGQRVHISVSIGITSCPDDGGDRAQLLRNADAAMYLAKQHGRGRYYFYTEALNQAAERRLALESHLRQAVEAEDFELHYQPQLSLADGHVVGAEALLRFSHDGQAISPDEFIPVLEDTGLINIVGEWVLKTACTSAVEWREYLGREIRVAVNLSGLQLRDVDFVDQVAETLAATELPSHCLEVEITEHHLIDDKMKGDVLQRLENMGVRLAIDDFGTGYSSLSYLKSFSVDVLKIDRSFIRDITQDDEDDAVTSAIIALARQLGIEVIAEGVESAVQQAFLVMNGCEIAQGFLFARPMPAATFGDWLRKRSGVFSSSEVRSVANSRP